MMIVLAQILFWTSIFLVIHSYVLYPIIVLVWASLKKENLPPPQSELPSISLIMSVYNEEKVIIEKLKNIAKIEYPKEKIEIFIGSDCSTDATLELAKSASSERTRIVSFDRRRGKASVLNDLAAAARNEILVFSDADTFYQPDALTKMARHFSDPSVGGVCGNLHLEASKTNSGGKAEALYWRYENAIKESEGKIKTTFGATGAIYAIRRTLFSPLTTDKLIADDFLIPLNAVREGFRIRYDASAECWEETADSTSNEFHRKIRIGAASFNGLSFIIPLLNPNYGFIAFGLISHKLIRWIVPFLLMMIFGATVCLSTKGGIYAYVLIAEFLFVCLASIGYILDTKMKPIMLFTMPYYFIVANAGLFVGFVRFLRGTQRTVWNV
jgi:cellulose synthase/poly-beta-1,6-N-acetylglucosamine synthase-like glycosyltransferase